jgi:hypothetical protein
LAVFCDFGDVEKVGEMLKNNGLMLHHPFHYAVQPYTADARFCAYQTSFIPVVIGFRYHRFQTVSTIAAALMQYYALMK